MREKKLTTVIAFSTTTQAMEMEGAAAKNGFTGRLIPIPGEITAGCGLAWKCGNQSEDEALEFMKHADLAYEGIYRTFL